MTTLRTKPRTIPRPAALVGAILCALPAIVLGSGCAGTANTTPALAEDSGTLAAARPVAPGQYAHVFDEMRDTLRDYGFLLERVDAYAGIITTQPKPTAGLARPWDQEQQTLRDEFIDLFHSQERVVRVSFEPAGAAGADDGGHDPIFTPHTGEDRAGNDGAPTDLRAFSGPMTMRVVAVIYRRNLSGGKLNTLSITRSTRFIDEDHEARNMLNYAVAHEQDQLLAQRLADMGLTRAGK